MANIIRNNGHKSAEDLKMELAAVDNRIGRFCSQIQDMADRRKELIETKRQKCAREDAELRDLKAQSEVARDILIEAIGGRKMALGLLKKMGVLPEETKFDRLLKNDAAAAIIQNATSRTDN